MIEIADLHERRMNEIILKYNDESLASILSYMSGYAGNHEFFEEAFWSAVDNTIIFEEME